MFFFGILVFFCEHAFFCAQRKSVCFQKNEFPKVCEKAKTGFFEKLWANTEKTVVKIALFAWFWVKNISEQQPVDLKT